MILQPMSFEVNGIQFDTNNLEYQIQEYSNDDIPTQEEENDGKPIQEKEDNDCSYMATGKTGETCKSLIIRSQQICFEGGICAKNPIDSGAWKFGIAQTILEYSRSATYDGDFTMEEKLRFGTPTRDGELSYLPFDYEGAALEGQDEEANLSDVDDQPLWKVPLVVTVDGTNYDLKETQMMNKFASWFALACTTPLESRLLVLLCLVQWEASMEATIEGGAPERVGTGATTKVTEIKYFRSMEKLNEDNYHWPRQLSGPNPSPDLRDSNYAIGNEARQGQLLDPSRTVLRSWMYGDESETLPDKQIPEPSNSETWFNQT